MAAFQMLRGLWQSELIENPTSVPAKSLQSCLTLCDPLGCSPPGSSVHGILQARRLEWVAMPSSRGSSRHKDWIQVSCIAGRFFFTIWATREAPNILNITPTSSYIEGKSCNLSRYIHISLNQAEASIIKNLKINRLTYLDVINITSKCVLLNWSSLP